MDAHSTADRSVDIKLFASFNLGMAFAVGYYVQYVCEHRCLCMCVCMHVCVCVCVCMCYVSCMYACTYSVCYYPACMHSKGLSNGIVCLSVHGQRNIETAEIRGYSFRKGYYNNICAIVGRS